MDGRNIDLDAGHTPGKRTLQIPHAACAVCELPLAGPVLVPLSEVRHSLPVASDRLNAPTTNNISPEFRLFAAAKFSLVPFLVGVLHYLCTSARIQPGGGGGANLPSVTPW